MKSIIALVVFMVSATVLFSQTKPGATIHHMSSEKFQQAMDSIKDEVIIDLRTPEELKGGKMANARHIDFFGEGFEPAIQALDRNKIYFIYCASGGRSGETVELMDRLGFKTIYNLDEGFRAWTKKGMPVSKR
jgi:rhodanese-related sulfurtransferase